MDNNEMVVERPILQQPDSDRVVVEKRIVKRRDRTAPIAILLVAAFFVTYAMLMAGDRMGSSTTPSTVSTAEVPAPTTPTTPD